MGQLETLFAQSINTPKPVKYLGDQVAAETSNGLVAYVLHRNGSSYYIVRTSKIKTEVRAVSLKGVCYIAGPMRGRVDCNFPAFDKARDLLIAEGYYVFSPADMDRSAGIDGKGDIPLGDQTHLREIMDRDCNAITKCTHLFLLPTWEESEGARPELVLAAMLRITFLHAVDAGFATLSVESVPSDAVCAVVGARLVGQYHANEKHRASIEAQKKTPLLN